MCLIALAWRVHPRYRLVLAGNRDEFHARPTLPLAPWGERPDIVGGRDALKGGSWLALRGRRLAAVTNVRRPSMREGLSRGALVADFLRDECDALAALDALALRAAQYSPFNLLVHDSDTLAFATNLPTPHAPARAARAEPAFSLRALRSGVHGVSNGDIDAPWPKVERLRERLTEWLDSGASRDLDDGRSQPSSPDLAPLFAALADDATAADERLPDTGIGRERERFLSSAFIRSANYGTRASTVVLIADDHAQIVERRFGPEGRFLGETRLRSG